MDKWLEMKGRSIQSAMSFLLDYSVQEGDLKERVMSVVRCVTEAFRPKGRRAFYSPKATSEKGQRGGEKR